MEFNNYALVISMVIIISFEFHRKTYQYLYSFAIGKVIKSMQRTGVFIYSITTYKLLM